MQNYSIRAPYEIRILWRKREVAINQSIPGFRSDAVRKQYSSRLQMGTEQCLAQRNSERPRMSSRFIRLGSIGLESDASTFANYRC